MRFSPLLLLVCAVIFVNGWTDAPNSIATVVISGTLPFRRAAALAAVCEFLGVITLSFLCPAVIDTIFSIADFGADPGTALLALQASFLSIVAWSLFAWYQGLPTSESHALVAALTGASFAIYRNFDGISREAWLRVLLGLLLSTVLGSVCGYFVSALVTFRTLSFDAVKKGQLLCAGTMSFFHGAQDGQKFLALLLLADAFVNGRPSYTLHVKFFPTLLVAGVMSLGVLIGGRRIIRLLAQGVETIEPRRGLAADLAAGICLLSATLTGLPVSTTHTKISALLGAGSRSRFTDERKTVMLRILTAWLVTFPVCALLSGLLTYLLAT